MGEPKTQVSVGDKQDSPGSETHFRKYEFAGLLRRPRSLIIEGGGLVQGTVLFLHVVETRRSQLTGALSSHKQQTSPRSRNKTHDKRD